MTELEFAGFPKELVAFYRDLSRNNEKAWFDAHKEDYERFVTQPSRAFIIALGERLKKFIPGIIADPRVNQSLFRIHRDARFSKDKTPFKTHLGLWFWEGNRPRMECSGFYFHVEPPNVMFAAGMHIFPKHILDIYRKTLADPEQVDGLVRAVRQTAKNEGYEVGGSFYKKFPKGFDPKQKGAQFLLHNALWVAHSERIPKIFHTKEFPNYAADKFRSMAPIHKWIAGMLQGVE
jgi:uncharacterized protein (TIGR02453 family)